MKNFVRSLFALLVVTLISSHPLFASFAVPEIDPSLGIGALAFLGGSVMILRGRVRTKR